MESMSPSPRQRVGWPHVSARKKRAAPDRWRRMGPRPGLGQATLAPQGYSAAGAFWGALSREPDKATKVPLRNFPCLFFTWK
jgi:hypothetical protein